MAKTNQKKGKIFQAEQKISFIQLFQDPAMTEQEVEIYSFTLNIQSIKMKIKFPCKMSLDLKGNPLTPDVQSNDFNKFIFNKEITLKEDDGRPFLEITANIVTDKGAKYIAGVIKLQQSQLIKQEGQLLVVQLVKCLDAEATCELRVDQVTSEKIMKKVPLEKSHVERNRKNRFQVDSPIKSPDLLIPGGGHGGTKSEFQFPLNSNKNKWEQYKSRQDGFVSNYQRNRSPNQFRKPYNIAASQVERNIPEFHVQTANREKLIEAEVYKEGYNKLKDKYKREAENAKHEQNKRIALENSQNNYKLEIMRLKSRVDEQEKAITEKNTRIRELQNEVGNLQKKEMDLQYLKEENSSKEHTIKMLEETIKTLNKDNEDLKILNKERFDSEQTKVRQLRNQMENIKTKFETMVQDLEREIRKLNQTLGQKEHDLKSKQDQIEREKRLVDELERSGQNRIYEFERSLQSQKTNWKGKLDELKGKYDKLEREKEKLDEEISNWKTENEKQKSQISKLEYDKRVLNEEVDSLKMEVKELKLIKDKYHELSRDHKLLTEDKNHLQKQLEKAINSKEINIAELTKQNQEQVDYYKKIFKDSDDKLKASQTKNVQLESQLEQRKNQIQKLKRVNDNLTREINDLKDKEKNLSKLLKTREEQFSSLSLEMGNFQSKHKSGDQLFKMELEKFKEEGSKYKMDYESQALKCIQLTENNANLTMDLNKKKLELQYAEEQLEKDTSSFKDKIQQLEGVIRNNELKIQELNENLNNLRENEKENMGKIQKMDIEGLQSHEKIERLLKEIKMLEDKVAFTENIVKNKQGDIGSLQNTKENLDKKFHETEDKLLAAKNEIKTITGEKNKNEKIISILQKDLQNSKGEIDQLKKMIDQKNKLEDELRSQIKKNKEDYLKLQMKNNGLRKEFEKFKQTLIETSTSTFAQIPMASDFKTSTVVVDIKKKDENGIHPNDVINKIVSQNKDLKMAMSKMIEQSKNQQGEIEKLNSNMSFNGNKWQEEEQGLQKQIQDLEEQLSLCYAEKEENRISSEGTIGQLSKKLDEEIAVNKDMMIQIEELNFTINSLKLDHDANNEHYNIKQSQFRSRISQLQEKVLYLSGQLEKEEEKSHQAEEKLNNMTSNFESQRESCLRREKEIEDLQTEKENLLSLLEELKRNKKELNEKISQLQFKFTTEVQVKEKTKHLLEDEETKGVQLKNFINNLMKQKEQAIKNELEKSEQIILLESNIVELTREKEMLNDECERNHATIEELKENIKKLNHEVKNLEGSLTEEKSKCSKLTDKLREKEKDLGLKEEEYDNLQNIHKEQSQKWQKESSDLLGELEDNKLLHNKIVNDLKDKILQFEKNAQQNQATIEKQKAELIGLEQSVFLQKQQGEIKSDSIARLEEEIADFKSKIDHLELTLNNLNEEVKEKEENLFQLSGKIYTMEVKLENKEVEKNEKIASIIEDCSMKYETMCDEYEQKLETYEKEKELQKARLDEKEEEAKKWANEMKNNEIEQANLKNILREKIKKLEDERLAVISNKNSEIQKLTEENKNHFDSIKTKEATIRKVTQELQISKSTANKLEYQKKQAEEKLKNVNKVYQTEVQQLRKKEIAYRGTKEALNKCQWNIEREVRKIIQGCIRKLVSGTQHETTNKIMESVKGLEQSVVSVIYSKIQQVK